MPIPVGIVTVIATMRSAGLSWSHDTCCVDREIGSLSNESISELLPSGVGRYRTAFLYERKALSSRHPRWRWLYLQQVFGAMPRRSGSHWRPGHVVAVARLDRTGPSTRDLLNTLAAITCTRPAFDPSATRGPTRRSRTDLPRAIRRRFACGAQRAPLRSRGLSSPKVRHCHNRAWSPPRADDLDRPRPLHDDPIALSISALHRVAAGLVVGPDDVLDVGVGNE